MKNRNISNTQIDTYRMDKPFKKAYKSLSFIENLIGEKDLYFVLKHYYFAKETPYKPNFRI